MSCIGILTIVYKLNINTDIRMGNSFEKEKRESEARKAQWGVWKEEGSQKAQRLITKWKKAYFFIQKNEWV